MDIFSMETILSLLTLSALEIVLGIDNVIFISLVVSKLPQQQRTIATRIGLGLAMIMRLCLLAGISWVIGLTTAVFSIGVHEVSWRDLILLSGGLFLLAKGTSEIHNEVEGEEDGESHEVKPSTLSSVLVQIMMLDIIFSLDSVITAVGMAQELWVMMAAVVVAVGVMLFAAAPVADFVAKHPTAKMLALSFLLLVGVALMADGMHFHIPRGYLYFAISFSVFVEMLNLFAKKNRRLKRK